MLAGICALFVLWLAAAAFFFGRGYGHSTTDLLPQTALIVFIAGTMGWIVWRFWRGGSGKRAPRIGAGSLAIGAIGVAVYSAFYDPGDAFFMVPIFGAISALFGFLALSGPQK